MRGKWMPSRSGPSWVGDSVEIAATNTNARYAGPYGSQRTG